jgi:hypothetical protein
MIGVTDLVSMQGTSPLSTYTDWQVTNNYLTGDNVMVDLGPVSGPMSRMTITGNIFATDLNYSASLTNHGTNADWRINSNLWRSNRLRLYPGDNWSPAQAAGALNGYFVWPDGSAQPTDFV